MGGGGASRAGTRAWAHEPPTPIRLLACLSHHRPLCSIAGREFVSSAHVLQPPSPALLRAQAQAAAQAEGRELTPAELESRAGELSDGWRRMIVIPLQTITALIGQGVSVTLG